MNHIFTSKVIKSILTAVIRNLTTIAGWVAGYPLSLFVRRNPKLTIVIGRPGSGFADNSKYFFIYATESAGNGNRVVFFTTDGATQRSIAAAGAESVKHLSLYSIFLLLRCGKLVTDNMDWYYFGAYPLTRGAKLVQIWHGAPLKHIELDKYRRNLKIAPAWLRPLIRIQKAVVGRYPDYNVVTATSQWFIDHAFKSAFNSESFVATGYPRNDILFAWPDPDSIAHKLAWINVDEESIETVKSHKAQGHHVCIYAPTFRKGLNDPFEKVIDPDRLCNFALTNNLLIVLKLHPFMHTQYRINKYPNLLEYPPLGDVYPLIPLADFMITDYSSIFFDYLLLDRPVVFFPYDLEQYLDTDRGMYFSYDEMTPGKKCFTYDELESTIRQIIADGFRDGHSEFRHKIKSITHDYIDNRAHQRLSLIV